MNSVNRLGTIYEKGVIGRLTFDVLLQDRDKRLK